MQTSEKYVFQECILTQKKTVESQYRAEKQSSLTISVHQERVLMQNWEDQTTEMQARVTDVNEEYVSLQKKIRALHCESVNQSS